MPLQSAVASSRQRQARAAAASRHDQTLFVQILKINCTNRSHFPNHMSAIFFLLFVTYLHKNRATWPCSSSPSHLQVITQHAAVQTMAYYWLSHSIDCFSRTTAQHRLLHPAVPQAIKSSASSGTTCLSTSLSRARAWARTRTRSS